MLSDAASLWFRKQQCRDDLQTLKRCTQRFNTLLELPGQVTWQGFFY